MMISTMTIAERIAGKLSHSMSQSHLTAWAILTDIRSERTLRYCGIYAACLCCFFYWDYSVAVGDVFHDGKSVGLLLISSKDFWSILLVIGACSIGTHYSMGFIVLLWQALAIVIALSGVILTPTMPAMRSSDWSGYLVICAMFTGIVGPLFGGLEPSVLHVFSFACAIVVGELTSCWAIPKDLTLSCGGWSLGHYYLELTSIHHISQTELLYTPLVDVAVLSGPTADIEKRVLTISNLWSYGIWAVCINLGIYVGISLGVMLLPPWRSARSQLHARAGDVLRMVSQSFTSLSLSKQGALRTFCSQSYSYLQA